VSRAYGQAFGQAFGKIILLGEHAVVHGHPALAGAIDRGVRLTATPGPLRLRIAAWGIDVRAGDDHPVARALADVAAAIPGAPQASLDGDADVPAAAGLGSSAATSVAVARALAPDATVDEIIAYAGAGERCFHGNPSGVDVELAARGGLGLYRRGAGLTPVDAPPIRVVVGLSGEPRATATMVARVTAALEAEPGETKARLAMLGLAAAAGARAIVAGDAYALGSLIGDAHRTLADLGLSTPLLDAMCDDAVAAGALGAKLTGGGGGGAVIALAPGCEEAVIDAWRARGMVGFACLVGARP